MIKKIFVFDIDGVLLSSLHRYRTMPCGTRIDLDHWRENSTPEKIWQDSELPTAELYKRCLADPESYVIIATARQCQQADFDSVYFKLGKPNKFIYRMEGDNQSGTTLKLKPLRKLINLKQFRDASITIFEDNKSYLNAMVTGLPHAKGHYIPSMQGH